MDINENLRELCAVGDVKLVKDYIQQNKPDLNSKNKVNGWTALHWACKRNHIDVVDYLVQNGASNEIENNDGKKPSFYTKEKAIKDLLNDRSVDQNVGFGNQNSVIKSDFVPNYLKYPDLSYLRHFKKSQDNPEVETKQLSNKVVTKIESSNLITIKIRLSTETDFIEIDLDKNSTTFEQFKAICVAELDLNNQKIIKIRKLPNVLVRNDNDIKRFKNDQEIEIHI